MTRTRKLDFTPFVFLSIFPLEGEILKQALDLAAYSVTIVRPSLSISFLILVLIYISFSSPSSSTPPLPPPPLSLYSTGRLVFIDIFFFSFLFFFFFLVHPFCIAVLLTLPSHRRGPFQFPPCRARIYLSISLSISLPLFFTRFRGYSVNDHRGNLKITRPGLRSKRWPVRGLQDGNSQGTGGDISRTNQNIKI